MTTAAIAPPPAATPHAPAPSSGRRGRLHRLSVAQYHTMIDAGILKPGAKVELVEGLLLRKPMTRKPIHDATIDLLGDRLRGLIPAAWIVRDQKALTLVRGEPEPDLAVVLGPYGRYLDHHPAPAEIGFVVEVSDTTLHTDRGLKLRNYARAGIPVYWVVNLVAGEVEVYADPHAPAKRRPKYRSMTAYLPGQAVPVILGGAVAGAIPVSDIIR